MGSTRRLRRTALTILVGAGAMLGMAQAAAAAPQVHWMRGFDAPGTPSSLDRVGVLRFGPDRAPNILVLNPGTSAGAAYFAPLARRVVKETKGWQVWSVERRENQLEDQSVFNRAKRGNASLAEVFDYYLRWLTDHSITNHVQPAADADVQFAKHWGMRVEIHDLRNVVQRAVRKTQKQGGHVVLGGHSLGGS